MASILCNKSSFAGATRVQSSKRTVARSPLVVRAQQESVDVVGGLSSRPEDARLDSLDKDNRLGHWADSLRVACSQSRRATLGSLAGAAALLSGVAPSMASFGDSANVFGKITNSSGKIAYAGDGFAVLLPSKWNPSKKELQEFPGTQLR